MLVLNAAKKKKSTLTFKSVLSCYVHWQGHMHLWFQPSDRASSEIRAGKYMNIWASGFKTPWRIRAQLRREKSSAVEGELHCFKLLSGDTEMWMTAVFSMERFIGEDELIVKATAPISIVISTTNKVLWVWEAYSAGRSKDPLPRH